MKTSRWQEAHATVAIIKVYSEYNTKLKGWMVDDENESKARKAFDELYEMAKKDVE
jgi:ssDNA-binding replication factor A large subunit